MDVELDGVRAGRDGGFLLDVRSLRLRGERTTAVLGPNGSGKTTLLRAIAGLERPVAGRIRIGGAPVRPKQHVAYVFQEEVFLRAGVRENLEVGLRLRGIGAVERRTRIAASAQILGIEHLLRRRADHLSGGERRRVSIARALCLRAPLVLLDEPLAGLDERAYSRLLDELPQLLAAFNATTVLVTHNRHEALRLAEDLVVLVDGTVHAAGEKRAVMSDPRVAEVAEVLGYSVLRHGGRRIAVAPGSLVPGTGDPEFLLIVDDVVDLIDRREIVGRVDGVRVHVALPDVVSSPARGDRLAVHAAQFCKLL